MDDQSRYIRRYTTLSNVLYSLGMQKLVLLHPSTWDDQNDVQFIEFYRLSRGIGSVLAMCCTRAGETYHHWKVYASGIEGICIEFHRDRLENSLQTKAPNVKFGRVAYKNISTVENYGEGVIDELPFLKRDEYSDEKEWRIISDEPVVARKTKDIDFNLNDIHLIRLNPWMPEALAENTRKIIKSLPGCSGISVHSSSLTNNARWIEAGRNIAGLKSTC